MESARNAFLASLCDFTLAKAMAEEDKAKAKESGSTPPSGGRQVSSMPTTGMQRGYSVMLDSSETVSLSPKNVQAFRTLFNIAHRLDNALDKSAWVHIIETIDALDRILLSPKATTQEVS